MQASSATNISDWDNTVESYLVDQIKNGKQFFKSRHIAEEFDVTAKKVGAAIHRLSETSSELSIETWGGTSDGTTWYVKMR
jgi:hypothetical protein